MSQQNQNAWLPIGEVQDLRLKIQSSENRLHEFNLNERSYVLAYENEQFMVLANKCNHMGAPLSKGRIRKGCIECPWHYWQFNLKDGESANQSFAPLAKDGGSVPSIPTKIDQEKLYVNLSEATIRRRADYDTGESEEPSLWRDPKREPGKLRVLGISTTAMDPAHPRFSTSEYLLKESLLEVQKQIDIETKVISLSDLQFRHCEGFYSKSEKACTWPCSITKIDPADEMRIVYENLVHWADVVIVGTPIRWGQASSLYYKMAERLNSVQNQITLKNKVLIQNKVASFIITGGQDNIQNVAGQMLTFFGELGFAAPPFPFVAHSLGWSSEDMQHNMDSVKKNDDLKEQAVELVKRSCSLAQKLLIQ